MGELIDAHRADEMNTAASGAAPSTSGAASSAACGGSRRRTTMMKQCILKQHASEPKDVRRSMEKVFEVAQKEKRQEGATATSRADVATSMTAWHAGSGLGARSQIDGARGERLPQHPVAERGLCGRARRGIHA